METWFIIVISLCIAALIKPILSLIHSPPHHRNKLPPGPTTIPLITNLLFLRKSFTEFESALRSYRAKYGPIITLRLGFRPGILISSPALAHQALVQNGAVFSDRPAPPATLKIISRNQHNISSAGYGPTWRLLRRNLTSEILHPSRVKSYSAARRWVLAILFERLAGESRSAAEGVRVVDHFQYAMFCLLVLMCFGDRLDEKQIRAVEKVQRELLVSSRRFQILNVWPMLGKIVFRNRWREFSQLRKSQEDVLVPLVRSRVEVVKQRKEGKVEPDKEGVVAYVDTLVDLELPDEKRKLNEGEMVGLCSEFLNGGTDTTSTALQWIMANLVKYPHVQTKLYEELYGTMGPSPQLGEEKENLVIIKEDDLQRMLYLKSVVLEGLRRHPPGHLVLPHTVTKDVEFEGYLVPKGAMINFMVADIGWDPNVWDEPMEFKPERFFTNTTDGGCGALDLFDITGSREIKMMPFGAGRRICPAAGLAMLHLEFFVANLVWYFEWTAVEGDTVDLSEKQEFTTVMKYPLRARISPRGLSQNQ
ncbi:hypothetical protein RHSIM_Rhsim03G0225200 [Rhododendron simsii]|uniref:Cytochrome P450 n=1 Tax=Rhododendron simsii TaxID=118357 RepID=A0A834H6Q6_RHOSS|nr:hypothetical protein RHSIM_Rhsim03G0225200 [Rhododendron simsii]